MKISDGWLQNDPSQWSAAQAAKHSQVTVHHSTSLHQTTGHVSSHWPGDTQVILSPDWLMQSHTVLWLVDRVRCDDTSLHEFISRRLGPELADYAVSSVVRGICAGDSKQVILSSDWLITTNKKCDSGLWLVDKCRSQCTSLPSICISVNRRQGGYHWGWPGTGSGNTGFWLVDIILSSDWSGAGTKHQWSHQRSSVTLSRELELRSGQSGAWRMDWKRW